MKRSDGGLSASHAQEEENEASEHLPYVEFSVATRT